MPEFFAFSSNIISVNNYGVKGGRVKGKNLHALSALTENRPPPVAETGLNYVSFCVYSRPLAEKMEANTRDTTVISLMRMLMEGPEVSLKGSPTVSPTTAARCASLPLPP